MPASTSVSGPNGISKRASGSSHMWVAYAPASGLYPASITVFEPRHFFHMDAQVVPTLALGRFNHDCFVVRCRADSLGLTKSIRVVTNDDGTTLISSVFHRELHASNQFALIKAIATIT